MHQNEPLKAESEKRESRQTESNSVSKKVNSMDQSATERASNDPNI